MQKGRLGEDFVVNGLIHFNKAVKVWCNVGDKFLYVLEVLNAFSKEGSYNIGNSCWTKILKAFF